MNPNLSPLPTASHAATNAKVFAIVEGLLTPESRVLDLGCGIGHMSRRIGNWFSSRDIDPATRVTATDISPDRFQAGETQFIKMDLHQPLPFPDASFDVIVTIEVIEHLGTPYDFLKECARLLRPGGVLVLSTPNILNLQSRFRNLVSGMNSLYEMPTVDESKAGRLCGHIMPLSLVYICYGLRKSGFGSIRLHSDKRKGWSTFLYFLLWPLLRQQARQLHRHTQRYDTQVFRENEEVLGLVNSFPAMTSRSVLVEARIGAAG